jgi:hypothetical protein
MTRDISEFDVFFLSYDEPNAEKHWASLLDICPWAKRVHGVKGFDAAHRACAEQSDTAWFVTVDADNTVLPSFFDQKVVLDSPLRTYSWNGQNMHNGLIYGNGGLKLWSKQFVLGMNSHENSDDPRKSVDFCWEAEYHQVDRTFSEVWVTGSPYQAFRVGFREAVKLTLDRGERIAAAEMTKRLHGVNLRNARIWACVGAHVPNGRWAMLGTRMGWDRMCDLSWDHTSIRDYGWFADFWAEHIIPSVSNTNLADDDESVAAMLSQYGETVSRAVGLALPALETTQSQFFCDAMTMRNGEPPKDDY